MLVHQLGLTKAIDHNLHLLKRHVPYFESDHVLNLTYNLLVGGKVINDLELLRNNEAYLDVLVLNGFPTQPLRVIFSAASRRQTLTP